MDKAITRGSLARALYETDYGNNGYPPSYRTIPWSKALFSEIFYERAESIIRNLASQEGETG